MNEIERMHNEQNDSIYDAWLEQQMARIGKRKFCRPRHPSATIDSEGFRHVWSVVNSRGRTQFFDSSKEAVELARNSVNQPCHISQHPILPCGYGWDLSLSEIADKIRAVWQNEGKK